MVSELSEKLTSWGDDWNLPNMYMKLLFIVISCFAFCQRDVCGIFVCPFVCIGSIASIVIESLRACVLASLLFSQRVCVRRSLCGRETVK